MGMELRNFVRDVEGFPKEGILFKDISPMLSTPLALREAVRQIKQEWAGKIDAIAALDARGFIYGSALAFSMGLPFVPLRKKGKLPGETFQVTYDLEYGSATLEIQADAFFPEARVLIVDDLLATGGTALAACMLVEKAGARVAGCAFVVELSHLGGRNALSGWDIQSLITYDSGSNMVQKPVICADVIAKYGDKFVLIERLNGNSGLALAGGKQDEGETLSATATREFQEETGLSIALEDVFGTYAEDDRDPRGRFITTVFVGTARGTPADEEGKTKVIILDKDKIFKMKDRFLFDHFRILSQYFERAA